MGIVVDQMRPDYLYRYAHHYGQGGFKRLMNQGFVCLNTHYNYIPTYTGPGHASIYTGTTPRHHGIVANNWFDRYSGQSVYCAEDSLALPVGNSSDEGRMSARNLLATNLADELKISSNEQAWVYAVSIKDRGAALPAGHLGDGAFWYSKDDGQFITSSAFMDSLPAWVVAFNAEKRPDAYLSQNWETLKPLSAYTQSLPDSNGYETVPKGMTSATFPYPLPRLQEELGYGLLANTPFGNNLVTDFALALLEHTPLGQDSVPDLLAISYSSTDYIGHAMGPHSVEVEDTYMRMDLEIERLLQALDQRVGKGQYTLFLTSDHGAVDVPQYLIDRGVPAGYFPFKTFAQEAESLLDQRYGQGDWLAAATNDQL
ncbi:MAG: alkaline phosphatase family protein [Cytophagales bacterium]|nr:alkaline phosphatase family protein [Cytophagales bacterium]